MKRKGPAVLAAEPEMKHSCDLLESSKGNRPFCVFHNVHNHNTNDYQELRAIRNGTSVVAPSAMIEATVVEAAEVEDARTGTTIVKSCVTSLVRTAGKARLARAPGGSSLMRSALRATQPCPLCLL